MVVTVLDGYAGFPDSEFERLTDVFAPLVVGLLGTEMASDVQRSVQALVMRIFERKMGTKPVKLMELSERRRGSLVGSPEVGRTPRMR